MLREPLLGLSDLPIFQSVLYRDGYLAANLIADALALQEAGAFAIVLEAIPDAVAETVTSRLQIPTIGIGAGPHCDGQVLVSYDFLGLFDTFVPPFVKQCAHLGETIVAAAKSYVDDVRQQSYPQTRSLLTSREAVPCFV